MGLFSWRKKSLSHLERIRKSERRLQEFRELNDAEKLTHYDLLRKALFRISDVINSSGISYENIEMLNGDVQLADIYLIPYADPKRNITYISYTQKESLAYPADNYEILDPITGKISQNGIEKHCQAIAVIYSLSGICERWLREIPAIEEILKNQEAESA